MIATAVPRAFVAPAQKDGMTAWDLGWRGRAVVKSGAVVAMVDRIKR